MKSEYFIASSSNQGKYAQASLAHLLEATDLFPKIILNFVASILGVNQAGSLLQLSQLARLPCLSGSRNLVHVLETLPIVVCLIFSFDEGTAQGPWRLWQRDFQKSEVIYIVEYI